MNAYDVLGLNFTHDPSAEAIKKVRANERARDAEAEAEARARAGENANVRANERGCELTMSVNRSRVGLSRVGAEITSR